MQQSSRLPVSASIRAAEVDGSGYIRETAGRPTSAATRDSIAKVTAAVERTPASEVCTTTQGTPEMAKAAMPSQRSKEQQQPATERQQALGTQQ